LRKYISLALYLTPPPEIETRGGTDRNAPDATQIVEIVPLLRDFVAAADLHASGWRCTAHTT